MGPDFELVYKGSRSGLLRAHGVDLRMLATYC